MILFEIFNHRLLKFIVVFLLIYLNIGCESKDKKEDKINVYFSEAFRFKDDSEGLIINNISPRLLDFRVESKFPNRLYFNSSEIIRGTSADG